MSFNLTFSNSFCGLLNRFNELVDKNPQNPFSAVNVIVPDIKSAETIKVSQAKEKGICANFKFLKIEEFIWKELSTVFTELNPNESCKYLTNDILSFLIFDFLNNFTPLINKYPNLKEYLHDKTGKSINHSRLAGLSVKLANLYMEYQYNRPASLDLTKKGFIHHWLNQELFFTPKSKDKKEVCKANEIWQMDIYNNIFGISGQLEKLNEKTDSKYYTVSGLYNEVFVNSSNKLNSLAGFKTEKIYLFSLKGLSMFHRQALFMMSEKLSYNINAFVINPCELYWEDTDTTNSRIRDIAKGRKNSLFIDEYKDNYLLKSLGHTGKENIVLWLGATNYDYDFITCANSKNMNLLKHIQLFILENNGAVEVEKGIDIDSSIAIFEFDDLLSEVEHLYDCIVKVLENKSHVKFEDIGVFVTDSETYLPVVEYVFAQKLNSLSSQNIKLDYSLSGLKAKESLFVSGMEAFVNLVKGEFSKKDFFTFFTNPLIASSIGVDFVETDAWKLVLSRLNVHRFFSSKDKESFDKSEVHTFTHAVKRVLLSQITDVDFINKKDEGNNLGSDNCYNPIGASVDSEIFNNLIYAIERIGQDVQFLKKEKLSFVETARFFIEFADSWFAKSDDFQGESSVKRKFKSSLNQLCIVAQNIGSQDAIFNKKGLIAFIGNLYKREAIGTSLNYKGVIEINELKNGVFRDYSYIFICGLSEKHYPSKGNEETVDLRSFAKEPGDVNRTRLDEYHFLETLLACGEEFYASFTGYDKKTDRELAASSPLITLKNYLEMVCTCKSSKKCVKKINAYSNHQKSLKKDNSLNRKVEPKLPDSEVVLDLNDISMYVDNPFRYYSSRLLNVFDEKNRSFDYNSNEFYESAQFSNFSFLKDYYSVLITQLFEQKSEIAFDEHKAIFNTLFNRFCCEGQFPESVFLEMEKESLTKQVEGIFNAINLFFKAYVEKQDPEIFDLLRIKKSPFFNDFFKEHNKNIFIRMELENVLKIKETLVIPIYSSSLLSVNQSKFYRELIKIYIAASIISATKFLDGITSVVAVVISTQGCSGYKIDINKAEMESYLKLRVDEMVIKEMFDFTPSEIALDKIIKKEDFSAEDLFNKFAGNYGYEKRRWLEIISNIDLTHNARQLAEDRFGNLLNIFLESES